MKMLISGFKPFHHFNTNPSEELVKALLEEDFPFELSGIILPVIFKESFELLRKRIVEFKPDVIVSFGLAHQRNHISLEKVAINLQHSSITDECGNKPTNQVLIEGAPDGIFTSLPIEMIQQQIPQYKISYHAGTYVCNELMYKTLHFTSNKPTKVGFVHLPATTNIDTKSKFKLSDLLTETKDMLKAIFHSI